MGNGTKTKSLLFEGRDDLTAEKLREQVHYDPETGIFTWRVSRKGVRQGGVIGGALSNGYPVLTIGGQRYLASRLAWLYVTGSLPENGGRIKNKNDDPTDIRFDNLRLAWTPQENYQNHNLRHPGINRIYNLRRYDGMTDEQYMERYVAQGACCWGCGQKETATRKGNLRWLCVDHCHKDGHVRGLLCTKCNTAVGYADDNPAYLRALADYLDRDISARANVIPLKGTA